MWQADPFAAPGPPDFRRQVVEVLPLADLPTSLSPLLALLVRFGRHHRWRWLDQLARNAWWGPPQLRITVAGVPAFLALH